MTGRLLLKASFYNADQTYQHVRKVMMKLGLHESGQEKLALRSLLITSLTSFEMGSRGQIKNAAHNPQAKAALARFARSVRMAQRHGAPHFPAGQDLPEPMLCALAIDCLGPLAAQGLRIARSTCYAQTIGEGLALYRDFLVFDRSQPMSESFFNSMRPSLRLLAEIHAVNALTDMLKVVSGPAKLYPVINEVAPYIPVIAKADAPTAMGRLFGHLLDKAAQRIPDLSAVRLNRMDMTPELRIHVFGGQRPQPTLS